MAPSLFVAAAARARAKSATKTRRRAFLAASLRTGRTDICRAVSARRRAEPRGPRARARAAAARRRPRGAQPADARGGRRKTPRARARPARGGARRPDTPARRGRLRVPRDGHRAAGDRVRGPGDRGRRAVCGGRGRGRRAQHRGGGFRGARRARRWPLMSREEAGGRGARVHKVAGSGVAVACSTRAGAGSGVAPASTKYVVCPAAPTAEERRALLARRLRPSAQAESVPLAGGGVQQERVVDLAGARRPLGPRARFGTPRTGALPCDAPLPPMQSLRINVDVRRADQGEPCTCCLLLRAPGTDGHELGRNKNTHLIAPAAEGRSTPRR